jgi:hypothetical protein
LPSVLSTSKEEPEKGPKIINFTDGSHDFARSDGLYEVFVIDAKGKFIKNKTVKGKKTKKGIAIIEEKMIADSAKAATEKYIEKLIKQKSISRECSKCKFCQIDGHFEVDCRKMKSVSKDNSSDKEKLLKTRTSRHLSQCSSPSQVLQLQPTLIPRMSPMNLGHMSLMRTSQTFLLHLKEAHVRRPASWIVSDDDQLPGLIDDSDDDSLPGLIDDSDSDDDSDVTIRHVRRRLPWRSRVDPSNRSFQEFTLTITFQVHQFFARCSHWVLMRLQPSLSVWKTTYRGC